MRIATCTPVDFPADAQFFGRDSGLLCRGFQAAGYVSVMVMPGTARPDDAPDLVRCTTSELISPTWWRALDVEMVVLYAWGDPRYLQVAEAIRAAGIFLVQSLDAAGLNTPYGRTREWWQCLSGMLPAPLPLAAKARLMAKALRDLVPALYEKKRLSMIDCCDRLAVVSAPAAESIAAYAAALAYPQIATKLVLAPHPISKLMQPPSVPKAPKVLVVGRWMADDKAQKDPDLTMAVLGGFLNQQPGWTAEVVGRGSTSLDALTRRWPTDTRGRLILTEAVPREQLINRYQSSRILLCCSRFESFHISSAEALCCGCSIVVADHPLLASTGWFTTRNSGTKARKRSLADLLNALLAETLAWEQNKRNPPQIAHDWGNDLHAHQVALKLLHMLPRHQDLLPLP